MFWRKFPNRRPKEDGWYYCEVDTDRYGRATTVLYWNSKEGCFCHYFNDFTDYSSKPGTYEGYRIVRDGVIAWTKLPKPYSRKS